jgi:superfamily II DNA or RNA helicase
MFLSRKGFYLPKSFKDILKIQKKLTVTPVVNPEFDLSATGPVTFTVYQENDTHLILPRSFGMKQFDKNEYINQIKIENSRVFNFNGSLRDYQQKIIDIVKSKITENYGGLISIPTGRGKTIIAVKLACELQLKTLFIVHKTFFLEQTKEKFEQFSNAKIGILQQKTIDVEDKDVVIGMLQSILSRDYGDEIMNQFDLVIFDECHHISSKEFSKIFNKIRPVYTIGLSATPKRSDGLEKVFEYFAGPMLYQETTAMKHAVHVKTVNFDIKQDINYVEQSKNLNQLKEKIKLNKLTLDNLDDLDDLNEINKLNKNIIKKLEQYIYNLDSKFKNVKNKSGQVLLPIIVNNLVSIDERNQLIMNEIIELKIKEPERKFLILSGRRDHLNVISEMVVKKIPALKDEVGFYIGGMKKDDLKTSSEKSLIFATFEMASEGLDILALDTLFMISPKGNTNQSIGRILRKQFDEYKYPPMIVDFVDEIESVKRLSMIRMKLYKSRNYIINGIIPEEINSNKLLTSYNNSTKDLDSLNESIENKKIDFNKSLF